MVADPWQIYWTQAGKTKSCLPGASDQIQELLTQGWQHFADSLSSEAQLLDIASGTGAVLHAMTARRSLNAIGVDLSAPSTKAEAFTIQTGVDANQLPFEDNSFDVITSQFGLEYAGPGALKEARRVAREHAWFRLIVHHKGSVILFANRVRLQALSAIADADVIGQASEGRYDRSSARRAMETIWLEHRKIPVVEEIAAAIDAAISMPEADQKSEWVRLQAGIAAEQAILAALVSAALDDTEAATLASALDLPKPQALMTNDGKMPLAWVIENRPCGETA